MLGELEIGTLQNPVAAGVTATVEGRGIRVGGPRLLEEINAPEVGAAAVACDLAAVLAERDILRFGTELVKRNPEVGAIVLECTNMIPYARALSDVDGVLAVSTPSATILPGRPAAPPSGAAGVSQDSADAVFFTVATAEAVFAPLTTV